MLRVFPADRLEPGDVMMTNDPWLGTGHLPDVTLVKPIFRAGRLVAFAGSTGHLPDIGGRIRSQDASELFEEGLRIPPIKFLERGTVNPTLELLLRANVRVPDQVIGDLMAHLAAASTLERRLLDFMDEQELDDLQTIGMAIQQRAERAMETAIETLIPPGEYTNEVRTDDLEDGPVVIRTTITVDGRRVTVDYAWYVFRGAAQHQCGLRIHVYLHRLCAEVPPVS